MDNDALTLSYFAGLFDGEGHISITKTKPHGPWKSPIYTLQVGVTNTHLPILEALEMKFGGSVHKMSPKGRLGNKLCYGWKVASLKAANFLLSVFPYLCIKRLQAQIALEYTASLYDVEHVRRWRGVLTDSELESREGFRLRLASSRG